MAVNQQSVSKCLFYCRLLTLWIAAGTTLMSYFKMWFINGWAAEHCKGFSSGVTVVNLLVLVFTPTLTFFVLFQGKFIRINFDASGYISGANIETCILFILWIAEICMYRYMTCILCRLRLHGASQQGARACCVAFSSRSRLIGLIVHTVNKATARFCPTNVMRRMEIVGCLSQWNNNVEERRVKRYWAPERPGG